MRGELDDTLARMARREALQRRRAAEAAGADPATPPAAADPVTSSTGDPAPVAGSPVDEVTEAVQRVVARHPALAVTMWVADGPHVSSMHVTWSEGMVTVRPAAEPALPTAGQPPHSWPVPVRSVPAWVAPDDATVADSAARLAELIRQNPSLLGRTDDEP